MLTIACHVFVLACLIVGGVFLHHLLIETGDPKLYDYLSWRYVADTADLGLAVAFVVFGTISFIAVLKDSDDD